MVVAYLFASYLALLGKKLVEVGQEKDLHIVMKRREATDQSNSLRTDNAHTRSSIIIADLRTTSRVEMGKSLCVASMCCAVLRHEARRPSRLRARRLCKVTASQDHTLRDGNGLVFADEVGC